MAGHSFVMIGWSWTEVSVLGSQVFGEASMESCVIHTNTPDWFQIYLKELKPCYPLKGLIPPSQEKG